MFHGLASSPKEFGLLAHPLRRHGVSLHAPSVAGYSYGEWAESPDWSAWADAGEAALREAVGDSPEPYVLGGLCTGAMLALVVASRRPPPGLAGLALMSPLFSYDGWALPWWYGLRRVAYHLHLTRWFSMAERAPYGLKNERMRELIRQQLTKDEATLVGPARVPLSFVRESERLSRRARAWLPRCALPVLVQHAREDEICSLAGVQAVLAGASLPRLTMNVLENSYHMIPADNDRHRVAEQLVAFLGTLALSTRASATPHAPVPLMPSTPLAVPQV